jgi:hypothetical protein
MWSYSFLCCQHHDWPIINASKGHGDGREKEAMMATEVRENQRKTGSLHPKSQKKSLKGDGQLPGTLVSSGYYPTLDPALLSGSSVPGQKGQTSYFMW